MTQTFNNWSALNVLDSFYVLEAEVYGLSYELNTLEQWFLTIFCSADP